MLYAAYGSNLNISQMRARCPRAQALGTSVLRGYRLVFRGVADVIPSQKLSVPIGIWRITRKCEKALDAYEGYNPNGVGLYRKETVVFDDGQEALIYVMNRTGIMPPGTSYYETILQGYRDFGLDPAPLRAALAHSQERQRITPYLRRRAETKLIHSLENDNA